MRIIIIGTPGTGKSTLANFLSKSLQIQTYNVTDLIKESELNKEYNKELDTIEVDESELKKFLDESFKDKKDFILDGHLAHLLSSNFVDLCLVLRCDNSVLYQRLTARGYSKDKIKDNLESEIFNQCYEDAKARNHKILTIDTSNFKDEDFSLLSDFIKANL